MNLQQHIKWLICKNGQTLLIIKAMYQDEKYVEIGNHD